MNRRKSPQRAASRGPAPGRFCSLAGDAAFFVLPEDQWKKRSIASSGLAWRNCHCPGRQGSRTLKVQPTARYHGQIQAFLGRFETAQRRRRSPDRAPVPASSSGSPTFAVNICPYRLGELEQSANGARLVEEVHLGKCSGCRLASRPRCRRDCNPGGEAGFLRTGDLFETRTGARTARQRPKTAGFFSDFQRAESGAITCARDHGIGQFEDCRRSKRAMAAAVSSCACSMPMTRGCMFRLERMDLVQNYPIPGGHQAATGSARWHGLDRAQPACASP